MTWDAAFLVANALAGAAWAPLLFAPRSRLTAAWVATPLGPLAFALVYGALCGVMWLGESGGDMGSLDGLREGFEQDPILLLAWVHYLSFDLFVGMWITRDRARLGLSPWPVAPCLLLTLMLGPVGLALYLGLRWATRRTLRFEVDAPQDDAAQDDDAG